MKPRTTQFIGDSLLFLLALGCFALFMLAC